MSCKKQIFPSTLTTQQDFTLAKLKVIADNKINLTNLILFVFDE